MALTKVERRARIKMRIRKVVQGTTEVPRLSVFRSNKQIYAQIIDDHSKKVLVSASSLSKGVAEQKMPKSDMAKVVGKLVAERALEAGIKSVVFDRNGYLYHGRIQALADAAREGGLQF